MNKYSVGTKVCISVKSLIEQNAEMSFVDICSDYDDGGKFYMLYNEIGELACLDGELCTIDHIVADGIYDLKNENGNTVCHFMLSEKDLDIAVYN